MQGKKFLFLAGAMVLLLATAGTVLALNADYNRPNPLMDYVPQEVGIYDTRYDHLGEMDCRACHGDSLADRHHYTDTVLRDKLCTPCHAIIPDPPGVVVIRDCTTSGCHDWIDVGTNGWHHNTNLSESENCVACHDRNVVAEITPFSSFAEYPDSVVTPTPFSCENCHWDQATVDAVPGFNPGVSPDSDAGHPSTFDHYNEWGQYIGYYEYNKDIVGNFDTHHMGFKGNVASQCWKCHSNDPLDPSWDPFNPELIRYCEICHDIGTLHTIAEHVGPPGTGGGDAVDGWEAVDFHVPGTSGNPTTYRTFEANEQCLGCHGDGLPPYLNAPDPIAASSITGITPEAGCPGALVELSGSLFGETYIEGERHVQFKVGTSWQDVPVYSWAHDLVVFEVPAWTFAPGNYKLRVVCDDAPAGLKNSNQVIFTLYDCASPNAINGNSNPAFDSGPADTVITLDSGTGQFGNSQDTLPGGAGADNGTYHAVEVVASQGTYVALNVNTWNSTKVKFRFRHFFEDLDGDYIQDVGEPTILWCDDLNLGTYSVYLKYIFYEDVDVSGGYTDGDTMFQVETSNPVTFELTNEPLIRANNPKQASATTRVRVLGLNFGPTQTTGEVRVGTRAQYNSDPFNKGKLQNRIKMWSSTKIAFRLKVPATWSGKRRFVWVIKDGVVSNRRPLDIL